MPPIEFRSYLENVIDILLKCVEIELLPQVVSQFMDTTLTNIENNNENVIRFNVHNETYEVSVDGVQNKIAGIGILRALTEHLLDEMFPYLNKIFPYVTECIDTPVGDVRKEAAICLPELLQAGFDFFFGFFLVFFVCVFLCVFWLVG